MAIATLQEEMSKLEKRYFPLLDKFYSCGNEARVFTEFQNRLSEVESELNRLPLDKDRFELQNRVTALVNALSAALNSAH